MDPLNTDPQHNYVVCSATINVIAGKEDKKAKKGKKKDTTEAEEAGFEVIDGDEVSLFNSVR